MLTQARINTCAMACSGGTNIPSGWFLCSILRTSARENQRASSSSSASTCVNITSDLLTHWGRDKMDAISQTTFWSAFSWMKMFQFRLKFHWSLFPRVQLTIFQHWFRWWLGAVQATSHYLNQWWLDYRRIYASLGLNELRHNFVEEQPVGELVSDKALADGKIVRNDAEWWDKNWASWSWTSTLERHSSSLSVLVLGEV